MGKNFKLYKPTIVLLIAAAFVLIFPADVYPFHDTQNHWAQREIDILSAKGILGGYHDGTFRPNQSITRAEFSKIIISALNLDEEAYALFDVPSAFKDVASNHWAKGYIELAYEMGIINGYDDGTFRPDRPIRRDELTAILVRTFNTEGMNISSELDFTDKAQIPSWAKEAVAKALVLGLVSGYPDGAFRPSELTTRAQASTFVGRMLDARGDSVEFAGILKGTDFTGQRLRIELNGQEHIFNFDKNLAVYENEKQLDLNSLVQKQDSYVHFIVDSKGILKFIEIVDKLNSVVVESLSLPVNDEFTVNKNSSNNTLNFSSSLYLGTNPGRSLEVTKKEMQLNELIDATNAQGNGQVIAIIDTGADPGHPDLQKTTRQEPKIVDWVDFTNELEITMADSINTLGGNSYKIGEINYDIVNVPTKSGQYRYGFIKESKLLRDLNFNGQLDDEYLVILSDPNQAGIYDTVYIDLDCDKKINGEIGYKLFKEEKQYFSFSSSDSERLYNAVIGGISPKGDWVRIGVDLNGHGTHVAGIAAANGEIKGVAPGSQLMILKALDRVGETSWELLKEAILYAAENGAHIINLSLGYYLDETAGNNSLTELIAKVSRDYNVVFTVATGNRGPGLASLATPGNSKEAISVGAFISSAMWKEDYGFNVENDSLWYFSSIGPRMDGLMIPDVVAPGSAVSTSPLWSDSIYSLTEGTSMAAPHVAGAVALLRDSLYKLGKTPSAEDIRRAITLGARPLENFGPAEVGAGVIDVVEAWRKLFLVNKVKPLVPQTYNKRLAFGEGLYAREFIPGEISFKISNHSSETVSVAWDSTVDWLTPALTHTRIAPGLRRTVPVKYNIPEEPGLYSGFLRGDIANTYGYDLTALVTAIRPYTLSENNDYEVNIAGNLPAAQYARYFFEVPGNAENFFVRLNIGLDGGQPHGRVRAHIIDPQGNEYFMTEYVGAGPLGAIVKDTTSANISSPAAGVWEVVVYSSPALSDFGLKDSEYGLQVRIDGITNNNAPTRQNHSWIIGGVNSSKDFGEYGITTYQVIDRRSKKPVNGVMEINGLVYEVRNGKIFITK